MIYDIFKLCSYHKHNRSEPSSTNPTLVSVFSNISNKINTNNFSSTCEIMSNTCHESISAASVTQGRIDHQLPWTPRQHFEEYTCCVCVFLPCVTICSSCLWVINPPPLSSGELPGGASVARTPKHCRRLEEKARDINLKQKLQVQESVRAPTDCYRIP